MSNDEIRADHKRTERRNRDFPGLPQGPCQCEICGEESSDKRGGNEKPESGEYREPSTQKSDQTHKALNEKVATLLGATWGHPVFNHDGKWHCHFAKKPFEFDSSWAGVPPPFDQCEKDYDIPDYCNDLDAMHEAEKTLSDKQRIEYAKELQHHVGGKEGIFATALQRAEDFVKTIEATSVQKGNEKQ